MDLLYNTSNTQQFDILSYLNDMYMHKIGPQIDVQKAGGYHNIHDKDNKNGVDEEILEINKKRIHIPDAEIKYFSNQQQGDIEEYNEPETTSSPKYGARKNETRNNETSVETEQTGGSSGSITQEVIEI